MKARKRGESEELWRSACDAATGLRDELNGYVRELHQRGRNRWTPFRAMGIVLRAESGGVPTSALNWTDGDAHDPADCQRVVVFVEHHNGCDAVGS